MTLSGVCRVFRGQHLTEQSAAAYPQLRPSIPSGAHTRRSGLARASPADDTESTSGVGGQRTAGDGDDEVGEKDGGGMTKLGERGREEPERSGGGRQGRTGWKEKG